jgi:hypothetical protein
MTCGTYRYFGSGVVKEAEQGELRATLFEPRVQAGVQEQHLSFAGPRQAALTMGGSTTLTRRADPGRAQQTAKGLAAEGKAFDFAKLLAEMVVVKAGVAGASQGQNALAQTLGQGAMAGPTPAGVCQSRLGALPITRLEAFDMPRREVEQFGGSGTHQIPLHAR